MTYREQRILEIELGLQKARRMKRAFWVLLAGGFLSIPSCKLYQGLKQTSPNYNGPNAIEKWWNEQQKK